MSGVQQAGPGSAASFEPVERLDAPSRHLRDLRVEVEELYKRTEAPRFGISSLDWPPIISEIVDKYLDSSATPSVVAEFIQKLRVDELALARACERGSEPAWEMFLSRYREGLYDAALSIARDDVRGRELADSIYGDLFGIADSAEHRVSKLHSYSGIGSLAGWLRTVLAQSFVDRYRYEQRFVDADQEQIEQLRANETVGPIAVDARVEQATDLALSALSDEDRFILLSHFLDEQTLADIAKALHVHLSTISRKIEKITKALRKDILQRLRNAGMTRAQADEALSVDVRDLRVHVRRQLEKSAQNSPVRPFSG